MKTQTRTNMKERFLFHTREITKGKALVLSARSQLQHAYRNAKDEGFDLIALRRELADLSVGKQASVAIRQNQDTYRKWLEEF